jgi:hypothetical protein
MQTRKTNLFMLLVSVGMVVLDACSSLLLVLGHCRVKIRESYKLNIHSEIVISRA